MRARLLDSLKDILGRSPSTRRLATGRPHIRAEIERRLAGRETCFSISPTREDIIRHHRARIGQDETPDAMDESLEAGILEKILVNIPEICIEATASRIQSHITC